VVAVAGMAATAALKAATRAVAPGDIAMEDTAVVAHIVAVVHIALAAVVAAIVAVVAIAAVAIAAAAAAPEAIAEMVGMPAMQVLPMLFSLQARLQLRRQSVPVGG